MKVKKAISLALCAAMALGCLAGCGDATQGETDEAEYSIQELEDALNQRN